MERNRFFMKSDLDVQFKKQLFLMHKKNIQTGNYPVQQAFFKDEIFTKQKEKWFSNLFLFPRRKSGKQFIDKTFTRNSIRSASQAPAQFYFIAIPNTRTSSTCSRFPFHCANAVPIISFCSFTGTSL